MHVRWKKLIVFTKLEENTKKQTFCSFSFGALLVMVGGCGVNDSAGLTVKKRLLNRILHLLFVVVMMMVHLASEKTATAKRAASQTKSHSADNRDNSAKAQRAKLARVFVGNSVHGDVVRKLLTSCFICSTFVCENGDVDAG